MGIDYIPFSLKPGFEEKDLIFYVIGQADSFQSMPWCWNTTWTQSEVLGRLLHSKHLQSFKHYCTLVKEKINLDKASHRVAVICGNKTFPPAWRLESLRTILPSVLPSVLAEWKQWNKEILEGKHQNYLNELYIHHLVLSLRARYEDFQTIVRSWLSKPRSQQKLSKDFFEKVFRFPLPVEQSISVYPPPFGSLKLIVDWVHPGSHPQLTYEDLIKEYALLEQKLGDLIAEWNANSSGGWKTYLWAKPSCFKATADEYTRFSFESFIGQASSDWLHNFFIWCQSCIDKGEGLYLSA